MGMLRGRCGCWPSRLRALHHLRRQADDHWANDGLLDVLPLTDPRRHDAILHTKDRC